MNHNGPAILQARATHNAGCQEYHLSLGLSYIRHFAEARITLKTAIMSLHMILLRRHPFFLARELEGSAYIGLLLQRDFQRMDEQEYLLKPWYADSDEGPEAVWRWAHHSQPVREFIFSPSQAPLRRWAYVMWDRDRLDQWKAMETPWEYLDRDTCDRLEKARKDQREKMYETRAKIMRRQGKLGFFLY